MKNYTMILRLNSNKQSIYLKIIKLITAKNIFHTHIGWTKQIKLVEQRKTKKKHTQTHSFTRVTLLN